MFAMTWHPKMLWEERTRRIRSRSDQSGAVNTSSLDLPPCPSSSVTLPTSSSLTHRRLIRFANLITTRSHRNSLAHVVERTFPRPDERCRHATFRPGNRNPTTTGDFTTRTSLRTRVFIPETWIHFCGIPGARDSRPELRPLLDIKEIRAASLSSALQRYQLFNPQAPTAPEHGEPVPTAAGHHHTRPLYDLLSLDRTRF